MDYLWIIFHFLLLIIVAEKGKFSQAKFLTLFSKRWHHCYQLLALNCVLKYCVEFFLLGSLNADSVYFSIYICKDPLVTFPMNFISY